MSMADSAKVCCAPASVADLEVIYYDYPLQEPRIIVLPNMLVNECCCKWVIKVEEIKWCFDWSKLKWTCILTDVGHRDKVGNQPFSFILHNSLNELLGSDSINNAHPPHTTRRLEILKRFTSSIKAQVSRILSWLTMPIVNQNYVRKNFARHARNGQRQSRYFPILLRGREILQKLPIPFNVLNIVR